MNLKGKRIGFIFTSSFSAFRKTIEELKKIVKLGAIIFPIMSENTYYTDTKYGKAIDFIKEIEEITGNNILHTIQEIECFEKDDIFDLLVVSPATSNTIAKLANDISDNVATFTINSHHKRDKPVVIGIYSNDGLSSGAKNIGTLLNFKNFYFVPFGQLNPITKPHSPVFVKIGFYSFYMSKRKYFSDCLL